MIKIKKFMIIIFSIVSFYFFSLNFYATQNTEITQEKFKFDCIISIGPHCRPAGWLRKSNLRAEAFPLDWIEFGTLDVIFHLFETKFEDFFKQIEENLVVTNPDKDYRIICDIKNGVRDVHHFKKDVPLEEGHVKFREMMLNRAEKMDIILKGSSAVCLISNRNNVTNEGLINFIEKFSNLYPNLEITLINVKDKDIKDIESKIIYEKNGLKVIEISFLETKHSWLGDSNMWSLIMNKLSLNSDENQI